VSTKTEKTIGVTPVPEVPINGTVSYTKETNNKTDKETHTTKAFLGFGITRGVGIVYQFDIQFGIKINYTKDK
jgi:hypothetical protein